MTRPIEFRGLRTDGKGWVYGFLGQDVSMRPIITNYEREWFVVFPETVGQFTGYFYENGEKFFEGDRVMYILKGDGEKREIEGVIEWHNYAWRLNRIFLLSEVKTMRKINTIHDAKP